MLQARHEPRLSDKARCSEAFRFSITKIWCAQGHGFDEFTKTTQNVRQVY